jgi:hypothetical protein
MSAKNPISEAEHPPHPIRPSPEDWARHTAALTRLWVLATNPIVAELQALLQALVDTPISERSPELETLTAALNEQARRLQAVFRDTATGDRGRLVLAAAGERPTVRLYAGHQKFRRYRAFPSLTVEREYSGPFS